MDFYSSEARSPSTYRQNEADGMVSMLRDLSIEANGGYIGGSSNFTVGRMVSTMLQVREQRDREPSFSLSNPEVGPKSGPRLDSKAFPPLNLMALVTDTISERLFNGYVRHISTRWPVLHSVQIKKLLARRHEVEATYDKCIIHLVYALGGRFIETTGEVGNFFPEWHHEEAIKLLDEILQYQDSRSAIVLFLLGVYSLRASSGPGAW